MASRGALLGFYIYLDYSCGSGCLGYEYGEHSELNALYEPYCNLVNAYTKYLWPSYLDDYNNGLVKINDICGIISAN